MVGLNFLGMPYQLFLLLSALLSAGGFFWLSRSVQGAESRLYALLSGLEHYADFPALSPGQWGRAFLWVAALQALSAMLLYFLGKSLKAPYYLLIFVLLLLLSALGGAVSL